MKNLQEATEKICDLKGNLLVMECAVNAIISTLTPEQRSAVFDALLSEMEAAQAVLLGASVSEVTVDAFQRDADRLFARFRQMRG